MNSIFSTHDGSNSIFSEKFNASYHSNFGAIEESITVFISAGFDYIIKHFGLDRINIFEMGFGSGLNAFLTAIISEQRKADVFYHTVDTDPVNFSVWSQLNYSDILGNSQLFDKIHTSQWSEVLEVHPFFSIKKSECKIQQLEFEPKQYHLIYYDAFAPSCQPELWEKAIHQQLYDALLPGGVLVTYCAQGKFKRQLIELGYQIESLPGPGKKKEMTRAIKYTS